jgi:putative serine protease PepD
VLRSDGTILTNNHVIASAADGGGSLSVKFNDGRTLAADIVGRDASSDLAVIRARGISNAKPAALGSVDDVNVGDSVLAIGSPLGLEGSVSAGIVSALHRPVGLGGGAQLSDAIQTDAAINPGNSGGALVDAQGRVIGINTAIATLGGGGRGGQAGSIGLGFAIPVDEAKRVSDQLVKGQQPTRAVLGVQAADAPDGGALVDAVTPGSAAERAGLRSGDVVVSVDGRTVDDAAALTAAIRSHDPGQEVRITVKRGGSERTIRATLGSARG